ncbi:MAG: DUF362 domain-containing protein [Methanomassiliicoccales archaeon]|nr:DUF362 domain-containing protein [Methanomassiliicoccales archaeon]
MAEVYFADMRATRRSRNIPTKIGKLMRRTGMEDAIEKGDMVAIKTHLGEPGSTSFLRPQFLAKVVDVVERKKGVPFLTDSNTLYRGGRSNAVDHLRAATLHGFTYPVVNAPVIIGDGLTGKDEVQVEIGLKHFERVRVSSAAFHADSIIGVAHFKGHQLTGFGGAIKNIGMGFGSRKGKLEMHAEVRPSVKEDECKACGQCARFCPVDAIKIRKIAEIDRSKCIGCGECVTTCPYEAMEPGEMSSNEALQEKIVEYCAGILKGKEDKCGFINFLVEFTPHCDCPPWSDAPIVPDVGILASRDVIALDQASVDLINQQRGLEGSRLKKGKEPGEDKIRALTGIDWEVQLEYGEEIGLGERSYRLIKI